MGMTPKNMCTGRHVNLRESRRYPPWYLRCLHRDGTRSILRPQKSKDRGSHRDDIDDKFRLTVVKEPQFRLQVGKGLRGRL